MLIVEAVVCDVFALRCIIPLRLPYVSVSFNKSQSV